MNQLLIPGNIFMKTASEFYEDSLNELKGKRILLFMTSSSAKRLSLENWVNSLNTNALLTWINTIPSNPTYINVHDALKISKGKSPEVVIAIGGGSTMDMAKACVGLTYLNDNNELSKKDVLDCVKTKEYLKNPTNIPIYAIPTTAGTGSEVTRWATVWDIEGEAKYSVDAPYLYPKRAYIIPEYTVSMSKRLTLSTGLDALCQATEAYWAKATNPMVKELSKVAIRLIVEYLPKVISDTKNLYYREKVFLGSLFSGLAFSNTRTTACHSMSYPLLFNAFGVSNTEELQKWLDDITGDIVNLRLSEFGIKKNDISELVDMSFTLGRMDNNPLAITHDDVRKILLSIM